MTFLISSLRRALTSSSSILASAPPRSTFDSIHNEIIKKELVSLIQQDTLKGGIQVAAYLHGKPIVNVYAGFRDGTNTLPVNDETLFMGFSVAKGVACTALCILESKELFDFDDKVTNIWPNFASPGSTKSSKSNMSIAEAAGYRGGMPEHPSLFNQFMWHRNGGWKKHWKEGIKHIENYIPVVKTSDVEATYHPLSFSWILGGIIEAADPCNRHISQVVYDDIALPLGYPHSMYLGRLPEKRSHTNRAKLVPLISFKKDQTWKDRLNGIIDCEVMCLLGNSKFFSEISLPSSNGFFTAASLAAMYSCWTHDNGVILDSTMRRRVIDRIASPHLFKSELSRFATKGLSGYRDSLGFHPYAHEEEELYGENAASIIGCSGAGGNVAFADPISGLSFAVLLSDYKETRDGGLDVAIRLANVLRENIAKDVQS